MQQQQQLWTLTEYVLITIIKWHLIRWPIRRSATGQERTTRYIVPRQIQSTVISTVILWSGQTDRQTNTLLCDRGH